MSEEEILCSFCGRAKSQTKLLIAGLDAHICDICISQADMIVKDDEASKELSDFIVDLKPPLEIKNFLDQHVICLLYTSPSPRDLSTSRMPSSA